MHRRQFIRSVIAVPAASALVPRTFVRHQKFRNFGKLDSEHFDIVRVSESVFAVRGKPDSGIPTNSSIIVGENGAAVVDAHLQPSLDREVIAIARQITSQPVRYLINTHWHQDHTLGNQAFEDTCIILGHETTRAEIMNRVVPNLELQREVLPDQVAGARETLAKMKAGQGNASQIEQLTLQIKLDEVYLQELSTMRAAPPTRVFSDSYKLDISDQPVELRHLGFGHTRGDIVVHLPAERTIILGDLVTAGQPFMRKRDAVPSAWASTLRRIAGLSWEKAVIGHGWVENPRDRLNVVAGFLDALMMNVTRAIAAGVPAGKVSEAVRPQLIEFAPHFPYFEQAVDENIDRAYEELSPAPPAGIFPAF